MEATRFRYQAPIRRGTEPDSYLVRIYRRGRTDRRLLVGTVETIGVPGRKGFTDFDELREILVAAPKGRRQAAGFRREKSANDS